MMRWEALTGADVLRMRQELKMGRDHLHPLCHFPNSKSAARLSNIELKNSWRDGDRALVVAALRGVYAERGLPIPDELADYEYTPPPATDDVVGVDVNDTRCSHSGGFTQNAEGVWVCANPECRQ